MPVKKEKGVDSFLIYHFFYKDYKTEFYFWETIVFLQKFLLTLLQNANQLIIGEFRDFAFVVVLYIYLIMVIKTRPFKREFINRLEISSDTIAILTKYCLILSFSNLLNVNLRFMFLILQLLLNILFIFHILFIIVRYTNWKKMIKVGVQHFSKVAKKIKDSFSLINIFFKKT